MTAPAHARRADARQGLTLGFAGFLPILSILSLAPALPAIIAHFRDVPHAAFLVPMMAATPGLMVALLSPVAGVVIDRYGRRLPLLWATFAYGFSGTLPFFIDDLGWIIASRAVVGVSEAFILVIVYALFGDYFDEGPRRNWLTIQGLLGPALGFVSLAGAGWLSSVYWNGVFLIYASAFPIYFAMLAWFFEPARPARSEAASRPATPYPWRTTAIFCAITTCISIVYYVFLINGGLAFEAIGFDASTRLGVLMGFINLAVPVGALAFNLLSRRLAIELVIAIMIVLVSAGTLGIGLARSVPMMAIAGIVQQFGAGITASALIFWITRLLPAEHRGRGAGLWTSAFFVAQFISPAIVGALREATGSILAAFTLMGAVGLAGAMILLALRGALPQPVAAEAAQPD